MAHPVLKSLLRVSDASVMAQPSTLESGQLAPPLAPLQPPAAPPRVPLTAPSMPSLAAPIPPAPPSLPELRPPTLAGAPTLAPLPAPAPPQGSPVPAWALAAPGNELVPLLPASAPTPPVPTMMHPPLVMADRVAAPEPVRLAAALDAAGAAFVPTSQTVAGRRAAELRATRHKRSQRVRWVVALAALAVIAVAGRPAVGWITDQVNGEPTAPEAPAVVDVEPVTG